MNKKCKEKKWSVEARGNKTTDKISIEHKRIKENERDYRCKESWGKKIEETKRVHNNTELKILILD